MVHLSVIQSGRRLLVNNNKKKNNSSSSSDVSVNVNGWLCPSMDLIVIGGCGGWSCYRTLSWQKVTSVEDEDVDDDDELEGMVWSPNGKTIVTLHSTNRLSHYDIETCSSSSNSEATYQTCLLTPSQQQQQQQGSDDVIFSPVMTRAAAKKKQQQQQQQQEQQQQQQMQPAAAVSSSPQPPSKKSKAVLKWMEWNGSLVNMDLLVTSPLIPSNMIFNSSASSSSLLMILKDQVLYLYWNGTFCILAHPLPAPSNTNTSSNSNNTKYSHVLLQQSTIVLLSQPQHNHNDNDNNDGGAGVGLMSYTLPLEIPVRLFHSLSWMMPQFQIDVSQVLAEKLTQFGKRLQSSLQPLEQKWKQLWKFHTNYGFKSDTPAPFIRQQLTTFLLSGQQKNNRGESTPLSSIMDQFFTHPLMNPLLLQRTQTTMEQQLDKLEISIKTTILTPLQQWLLNMESLLSSHPNPNHNNNHHHHDWVDSNTCLAMIRAIEITLLVVQQHILPKMLFLRKAIPLIWNWMKSTVSQVKARGTAMDSVQRKLAKERRISQSTLHQITTLFSTPTNNINIHTTTATWTEQLVGIDFSSMFQTNQDNNTTTTTTTSSHDPEIPTLTECYHTLQQLWNQLCEQPRQKMSHVLFQSSCTTIAHNNRNNNNNNHNHNHTRRNHNKHTTGTRKKAKMMDVIATTIPSNSQQQQQHQVVLILQHGRQTQTTQTQPIITEYVQILQQTIPTSSTTNITQTSWSSPKLQINGSLKKAKFYKSNCIILLVYSSELKQHQLWLVPIHKLPKKKDNYDDDHNDNDGYFSLIVREDDDDDTDEEDDVGDEEDDHDDEQKNDMDNVVRCKMRPLESNIQFPEDENEDIPFFTSSSRGIGGFITTSLSNFNPKISLFDLEEDEDDEDDKEDEEEENE